MRDLWYFILIFIICSHNDYNTAKKHVTLILSGIRFDPAKHILPVIADPSGTIFGHIEIIKDNVAKKLQIPISYGYFAQQPPTFNPQTDSIKFIGNVIAACILEHGAFSKQIISW